MSIFKKRGGQISATSIPMTEAEAALAQSDFNIEKITEIQNKFTGGAILLVPGRIFIREGLLWKVCRKGTKKRQFFLFNDILVYGSVVASRYNNQHSLALDKMSVSSDCFYQPRVQSDFDTDAESLDQQLDPSNAFQISHADKSFHVFAASAADKANWLANLNKHISRAAQLVADSPQQMITRPVWVPDAVAKECMVCHTKFSTFVRKHHCRRCGRVVCSSCSPHHVSLASSDPGSSSHTPSSGEHTKLERVCKECFKEMTAQHNRTNSQSRGSREPKSPHSANRDVLSLSTSLSGTLIKSEDHDSTDTEDSDDSSDDKSAFAEQSDIRTGSLKQEPDSRTHQVAQSLEDVVKDTLEKRDSLVETKEDSSISEQREGGSLDVQPREGGSPDVQPTPPPRKKKLEKLLKKQIEASGLSNKAEYDTPAHSEGEKQTDFTERELPNAKKTRRKIKHSKPADNTDGTVSPQEPSETTALDEEGMTESPTTQDCEMSEQSANCEVDETDAGPEEEREVKGKEEVQIESKGDAPTETNQVINPEEPLEAEQEHSPSQKKARGRRKKFKTASERTHEAS